MFSNSSAPSTVFVWRPRTAGPVIDAQCAAERMTFGATRDAPQPPMETKNCERDKRQNRRCVRCARYVNHTEPFVRKMMGIA